MWRYQQLCGFRVSDRLPPSYPHLMAFPLMMARFARPDFPFPVLGLVHLTNQLRQHRPIRSSERLGFSVRLADRREHPAGELIDLITEASSGTEPVWQETSSYLHRSGGRVRRARRARNRSWPPSAGTCRPTSAAGTRRSPAIAIRSTCTG